MSKRRKKGEDFQDLVADVARRLAPNAQTAAGGWVFGPDGRRDLDVAIRGIVSEMPVLILIECKDYTYSKKPTPVGIDDLDKLESKRRDLKADVSIIASNSGFTKPALSKAVRTGIEAVTVLKDGDPRAKARIERQLIFRRISPVGDNSVSYWDEYDTEISPEFWGRTTVCGELVDHWLLRMAVTYQAEHPWNTARFTLQFRFTAPAIGVYGNELIRIVRASTNFQWTTQWFRQPVVVDADVGMYDYIKDRLLLPPGKNEHIYKEFDPSKSEPCDPPTQSEYEARIAGRWLRLVFVDKTPRLSVKRDSRIPGLIWPDDIRAIFAEDTVKRLQRRPRQRFEIEFCAPPSKESPAT